MSELPPELSAVLRAGRSGFEPSGRPPLHPLRRRARRRRVARGGALAGVGALACAALVSLLPSGGQDRVEVAGPSVATPTVGIAHPVSFDISFQGPEGRDGFDEAVKGCLRLPGTSQVLIFLSKPGQYSLTVTGDREVTAFRACVRAVPGAGMSSKRVQTLGGTDGLLACPTDVSVCLDDGQCEVRGAAKAQALRDLLASAPVTGGPAAICEKRRGTNSRPAIGYRVFFTDSEAATMTVLSPDDCQPLAFDGRLFSLDEAQRAAVRATYESPLGQQDLGAFVQQCLGDPSARQALEVVGLTEAAAERLVRDHNEPFRVVGRDGGCSAHTKDLRGNRVNVVLNEGRVVGAARF